MTHVVERGPPARPGAPHRHRAARAEGARAHRLRRAPHLAQPAARLPDRAGARRRAGRRGHRRQRLPRLRGRHRRHLDRPRPPRRDRGDHAPGGRPDPLQRLRLLPAHLRAGGGRARRASRRSAGRRASSWATRAPRRSRPPSSWRATTPAASTSSPSWARFHGRTYGAVSLTASKAKYHAGFGPLLPGVIHVPFGSEGLDELEQRVFKRLVPARGIRGGHRRAHPGRGRLRRARRRVPASPAADLRRARHPARRRRGPVGRRAHGQDVGHRALGRRARHPVRRQGHRLGHAASRRMVARADLMSWAIGRARLDVRRQSASPARPPWRPSSCSRAASSRTRPCAASRPSPALRPARAAPPRVVVRDVRGKGLMIGVQFDPRPRPPTPSSWRPSTAACWCSRPATTSSACRRRSRRRGRGRDRGAPLRRGRGGGRRQALRRPRAARASSPPPARASR